MLGPRLRVYSQILFLSDIAVGFLALALSYPIRKMVYRFGPGAWEHFFNPILLPFGDYLFYLLVLVPAWVPLLWASQGYGQILRLPLSDQFLRVLRFVLLITVLTVFLTFTLQLTISRPVLFTFLFLFGGLMLWNRFGLNWVLRSRGVSEHSRIRILIIGANTRARRVGALLENYRKYGYEVVGYVARRGASNSLPILATLQELPRMLVDDLIVDEVIFLESDQMSLEELEETIELCQQLGIRTRVAADFFPAATSRISLEFLDNLPLITFSTAPDQGFGLMAKRLLDFAAASILLAVLSPILVLTGLLIKFTSQGPVLYRQTRCGLYGRTFGLLKFRTMIRGAEDRLWEIKHLNEMDGPVFKMRDDPRVTPLGRFLRRYSIDELPQLWNVIRGEMSLVGPRAPLPEEVKHYSIDQRRRLSVRPGITCLWQVSGRSDIDFQSWMRMDLHYIDNWSFWMDLQILLKTIPAVVLAKGAR